MRINLKRTSDSEIISLLKTYESLVRDGAPTSITRAQALSMAKRVLSKKLGDAEIREYARSLVNPARRRKSKINPIDVIREHFPEAVVMDGYDDCIIGICQRFGQESIVAYDRKKVIRKLMKDGMSYDDAEEFHEFNQAGAWVGKETPCFIIFAKDLQ